MTDPQTDRVIAAIDRLSAVLVTLTEVAKSANNALVTIAEHIDPDGDLPPEFRQSPPYRRVHLDVELPDHDSVLCARCQTVRPVDPKHPGHPDVHDCRPWEWKGPVGDHDERQQDNAQSDSWDPADGPEPMHAVDPRDLPKGYGTEPHLVLGTWNMPPSERVSAPSNPSNHSWGRATDPTQPKPLDPFGTAIEPDDPPFGNRG